MVNSVRDSQIDNVTLDAWVRHPLVQIAARRAGADLGTVAHLESLRSVLTDLEDCMSTRGTSFGDLLDRAWNEHDVQSVDRFDGFLQGSATRVTAAKERRAKSGAAFEAMRDGMSWREARRQFDETSANTAAEWLRA